MSQNRQVIHLECCEAAAPFILQLCCNLKEKGKMKKCFGKYFHITKPLIMDIYRQECMLLHHMAQLHTNYHTSVQLHYISGIVDILATAQIGLDMEHRAQQFYPTKSLWEVLYGIRSGDKSPLFLSILPWPGGSVSACDIPNMAAVETKLVKMN